MQGPNSVLNSGLINNTGYSDFRSSNKLDVDALFAERSKHFGCITRCILHTGTDYADAAQSIITDALSGVNGTGDLRCQAQ